MIFQNMASILLKMCIRDRIKLSDEVAKIQETANNIAIETEAEIMGISFWEIAFLKENIKVFDSFLSKEELKELTEQIEKRINEIPRIPKATVELYKKTGRPLPIRKDKSVLLMPVSYTHLLTWNPLSRRQLSCLMNLIRLLKKMTMKNAHNQKC